MPLTSSSDIQKLTHLSQLHSILTSVLHFMQKKSLGNFNQHYNNPNLCQCLQLSHHRHGPSSPADEGLEASLPAASDVETLLSSLASVDPVALYRLSATYIQWPHYYNNTNKMALFQNNLCKLATKRYKKLSYRRGTARCAVSVKILPTATQQCRNYLYDKSWTKYQLSLTDPCDKIVL